MPARRLFPVGQRQLCRPAKGLLHHRKRGSCSSTYNANVHRYPKAAEQLALRAQRYNAGIVKAEQLAAEGKVLIVAPDDTCGIKTLTRDQEALKKMYAKGLHDAEAIRDFIK